MYLSLQFFSKEQNEARQSQQSKEHNLENQYTSDYMEIEVDGVVYSVCLHQPTEDTATATEIIKI